MPSILHLWHHLQSCSMQQCTAWGSRFHKPTPPVAPTHPLDSCLLSFPLPSHGLGSLLSSNTGAASVALTPQCFRFVFAPPPWWCPIQADLTHVLTAFMCLCGAACSTLRKSVLCRATAETFSPAMASTAAYQNELAALGTRPFAPCPRQQAASTSSEGNF